ncbi:hypothetical protein BX616_005653, partial [Lobosporangium transversale]
IETFPLGKYDVSHQFILPNAVFGRREEQQMISAAISQAASAYQHSLNSDLNLDLKLSDAATASSSEEEKGRGRRRVGSDLAASTIASAAVAAEAAKTVAAMNDHLDHYVFEDEIVSLRNQGSVKIPLLSTTLLRSPKPFDGGKAVHRGSEATDPVVRAIFVSGPSGVCKS